MFKRLLLTLAFATVLTSPVFADSITGPEGVPISGSFSTFQANTDAWFHFAFSGPGVSAVGAATSVGGPGAGSTAFTANFRGGTTFPSSIAIDGFPTCVPPGAFETCGFLKLTFLQPLPPVAPADLATYNQTVSFIGTGRVSTSPTSGVILGAPAPGITSPNVQYFDIVNVGGSVNVKYKLSPYDGGYYPETSFSWAGTLILAPEPSSLALLAVGVMGLGAAIRKRA